MKYSIIVPVFNRPDEVGELLKSLTSQTYKDFEVIVVEDGSTKTCKDVCDKYADILSLHYYYKENSRTKPQLFPDAWVWHKRRTDFRKFWRQVYNSGIARINLEKRHPGTLKLVHLLPTVFTLGVIFCCLGFVTTLVFSLLSIVNSPPHPSPDLRLAHLH